MVQGGEGLAIGAVDLQVVVLDLVGGQKPNTARLDQLLVDQLLQHRLGVVEQRGGGLADHLVGEDARVLAGQVPGMKNGVQSMYSASTARSISSSTLTPVKEGVGAW